MLQARFAIVRGPARLIDQREIGIVMRACVILHNMIVEDKQDNYEHAFDYDVAEGAALEPIVNHMHHSCDETYFQRTKKIGDPDTQVPL